MGLFSGRSEHHKRNEEAYGQVYNDDSNSSHKSSWTHELVGGAASAYAMKKYEEHERSKGKEVDHGKAKEFLAGLAGAEVDRLAETKGLDALDREKAKRHAQEQAEHMYAAHYQQ